MIWQLIKDIPFDITKSAWIHASLYSASWKGYTDIEILLKAEANVHQTTIEVYMQ